MPDRNRESARMKTRPLAGLLLLLAATTAVGVPAHTAWCGTRPLAVADWELVAVLEHDPEAFTQGLAWFQGRLFESTGGYGASSLRELDPESGRVVRLRRLDSALFGEGLAACRGRLWQLTWREGRCLVWDMDGLQQSGTHEYLGEGWGLAALSGGGGNKNRGWLVMSDGSHVLTVRGSADFALLRTLAVTMDGEPLEGLNELEYAKGLVWANVYKEEYIVGIDLKTGRVRHVLDISELADMAGSFGPLPPGSVANGIAYLSDRDLFLVTGKNWPAMYLVRLTLPPLP
jgi:glutaminyl-peptide cyclotransferase